MIGIKSRERGIRKNHNAPGPRFIWPFPARGAASSRGLFGLFQQGEPHHLTLSSLSIMFHLLSTLFHQPINTYPKQLHLIVSSIISTFFSLLKHSFSLTLFNMEPYGDTPAQSPNHRIKFSMCLCCCFRGLELAGSLSKRRLVGRSSAWLRSTARELPVIKEKCRNLMARMRKRHRNSVDFSYDPLSYALNFDDGENDEAQMMKSFSARLPALPPQGKCAVHPTVAMPEIVACG